MAKLVVLITVVILSLTINQINAIWDPDYVFTDRSGNACSCGVNERFVCGSDGRTYYNEDVMNCANKCKELTGASLITVSHEDPCYDDVSLEHSSDSESIEEIQSEY